MKQEQSKAVCFAGYENGRIFYAPDIQTLAELPEEEAGHCARVLRLKEGDEIWLTDGKGYMYQATLTYVHHKRCSVEVTEKIACPAPWNNRIHIAIAPTKNMDRMEWFAEKVTEIGINELSLLHCRFSERKEIKIARMQKIMIAAIKQSQKAVLPVVNEMTLFRQFIQRPIEGQKYIAHCYPGEKRLIKDVYRPGEDATLLIGPEGDFSEDEVKEAVSAGFIPVSLGESRLRTETAALVACHTIHVLNQ